MCGRNPTKDVNPSSAPLCQISGEPSLYSSRIQPMAYPTLTSPGRSPGRAAGSTAGFQHSARLRGGHDAAAVDRDALPQLQAHPGGHVLEQRTRPAAGGSPRSRERASSRPWVAGRTGCRSRSRRPDLEDRSRAITPGHAGRGEQPIVHGVRYRACPGRLGRHRRPAAGGTRQGVHRVVVEELLVHGESMTGG